MGLVDENQFRELGPNQARTIVIEARRTHKAGLSTAKIREKEAEEATARAKVAEERGDAEMAARNKAAAKKAKRDAIERLITAVHDYRDLVNLEDTDCTPAPLADIAALNATRLALHAAVELAVLEGWTPAHDHDWHPSSNVHRSTNLINVVSSTHTR